MLARRACFAEEVCRSGACAGAAVRPTSRAIGAFIADGGNRRGSPGPKSPLMRSAASIPLIACLALAACASKPKPDLRLPAAFEAPQPAATTPVVALDNWWTTFHDPQLNGLIEQA